MPKMVCANALCKCDKGVAPTPLAVTTQMVLSVEGFKVATVMDFAPMSNIKPFGICQELTKQAQGVPVPCVPAPTGPWSPGSQIEKIEGFKILTADSKLKCGIGGNITIAQPNCLVDVKTE